MSAILGPHKRAILTFGVFAIVAAHVPSCGGDSGSDGAPVNGSGAGASQSGGFSNGGNPSSGGVTSNPSQGGTAQGQGGTKATGVPTATGGGVGATGGVTVSAGGAVGATGGGGAGGNTSVVTAGAATTGGTKATGGSSAGGNASGGSAGTSNGQYTVAMVQSSKANASDITADDVTSMVGDAITKAGGLGFIRDGQTVVLKPNLLTPYVSCWSGGNALPQTVNGVTTDWRVTKAVADLVRAQNPTGKILVMEGSARSTTTAYSLLGYTSANFGTSVDEFIALEGTGCNTRSTSGLIQKPSASGKLYWVNERYFNADVVISIGALKTHGQAGTTGCVKNLGVGATPSGQYSVSTNSADCTRNMSQSSLASYIDHSTAGLGNFVSEYYSVRPADFAVMDGLQGLQRGPCSPNVPASDKMNMRLVLAARNAVALDTIQAMVMSCDPQKVQYLTKLASLGLGTTDPSKISVIGVRQGSSAALTVADVKKSFVSGVAGLCN